MFLKSLGDDQWWKFEKLEEIDINLAYLLRLNKRLIRDKKIR